VPCCRSSRPTRLPSGFGLGGVGLRRTNRFDGVGHTSRNEWFSRFFPNRHDYFYPTPIECHARTTGTCGFGSSWRSSWRRGTRLAAKFLDTFRAVSTCFLMHSWAALARTNTLANECLYGANRQVELRVVDSCILYILSTTGTLTGMPLRFHLRRYD
jgi:hypothetical protein